MQEIDNISLNPILEPIPVAFTMESIGWKILFMILLLIILYNAYKYYIHYKNNAYRRDAIAIIQNIANVSNESLPSLITQVMFQIKQTAILSFGRKHVASLEGKEWLKFLDNSAKGVRFSKYQEIISQAVYKGSILKDFPFDKELFIKSSLLWIRKHAR